MFFSASHTPHLQANIMLINFPYINRDSPIHRLDPRTKILLLLTFSLAVVQTSNFWYLLVGLLIALFYYRQAHLKWSETKQTWRFIIIFVTIVTILNYFLSGGAVVQGVDLSNQNILFTIPFLGFQKEFPFIGPAPLIFSVQSITFLITQAMRFFSIALFAVPISYTTAPDHFGVAFKGMGLPDKFAYAVDLSFRFLPTIVRDFGTTLDAQRARGYEIDKLRGGIFGKIARLAPMIVPVVIGSILGAEDIINAMELRCFGIGKRTWFIKLHTHQIDRVLITLGILGFVATTILNILGYFYTQGPLHVLHTQGIPPFLLP